MPTNYPGAVDSYTTKIDGTSDVLAADINNLQDAVVAVQTRVGTTASSPTFVTVAGAQTVSGAKTFSSAITLGSAQMPTPGGSAPVFGARAWVNFNGTGTVAIRASGNVTSITDNGAGDYTVNFTTALPDVSYAPVVSIGLSGTTATKNVYILCNIATGARVAPTTSGFRFGTAQLGSAGNDNEDVTVAVFR